MAEKQFFNSPDRLLTGKDGTKPSQDVGWGAWNDKTDLTKHFYDTYEFCQKLPVRQA